MINIKIEINKEKDFSFVRNLDFDYRKILIYFMFWGII